MFVLDAFWFELVFGLLLLPWWGWWGGLSFGCVCVVFGSGLHLDVSVLISGFGVDAWFSRIFVGCYNMALCRLLLPWVLWAVLVWESVCWI